MPTGNATRKFESRLARRMTTTLVSCGVAVTMALIGFAGALSAPAGAAARVRPDHSRNAPGFPGTSTTAPFNECPAIGYADSCGVLIIVSNNGDTIVQDPNNEWTATHDSGFGSTQDPYDNNDDTLVGIVNESSKPLYRIQLVENTATAADIFGFDGDGICTYAPGGVDTNTVGTGGGTHAGGATEPPIGYTGDTYCTASRKAGHTPGATTDAFGGDYEGPDNTYSTINATGTSGNVDFTNGVAPGGSAYFSLEEDLNAGKLGVQFGYWEVASDGGIFAYDAPFFGSMGGKPLNQPIVGICADPATGGYWEVAADGGLFAFNAPFYGSMGGKPLNEPIVGMTATPTGGGYWEVASDGGLFAFGNAAFYGSMGGKPLNEPIVGIASTQDGKGYWEVASDGGLFSFGDAAFHGSMGGRPLNDPVVGIAEDQATGGYWEVASDGGLFSFTAPFFGSPAAMPLNKPVVGMAGTPDGQGYWESASDGGIFNYGASATFWGSTGSLTLNAPVVGIASSQ